MATPWRARSWRILIAVVPRTHSGVVLRSDHQRQTEAIQHLQELVEADRALAVLEAREKVDGYATQCCCIVDA
jgi:hypothetical protein